LLNDYRFDTKNRRRKMVKLGEMLVKEGMISPQQLKEALEIQKSTPDRFL